MRIELTILEMQGNGSAVVSLMCPYNTQITSLINEVTFDEGRDLSPKLSSQRNRVRLI